MSEVSFTVDDEECFSAFLMVLLVLPLPQALAFCLPGCR
jgi:hypothetical protein